MTRNLAVLAAVACLLAAPYLCHANGGGIPPGSVIGSNVFTLTEQSGGWSANDFHLQIHGEFTQTPTASGFANKSWNRDPKQNESWCDFSGGTVPPGGTTTVTFNSNSSDPDPTGWFTHTDEDGKWFWDPDTSSWALLPPGVRPADSWGSKSKGVEGLSCIFVPSGLGYTATLDLVNDFGAPLLASVDVYVYSGFFQYFDMASYGIPRNPRLVFSSPVVLLLPDQGWLGIIAPLFSDDDYIYVRGWAAEPGKGASLYELGISPVATPLTLRDAKLLPDGQPVLIRQPKTATVGSNTYAGGFIYIEEPTRASGVRCRPGPGLPVGRYESLTVYGRMATDPSGERVLQAEGFPTRFGLNLLRPLGMSLTCASGGFGLETSGLLVRVWGKVSSANVVEQCFYLDDGSGSSDAAGGQGVRVSAGELVLPLSEFPSDGQFAMVTGLVGRTIDPVSGGALPTVRPRDSADVTIISLPPGL